ncbi:J domain-containing protein [Paenibacillus rigui]|uniref:Molecular chaperone DnaJ n=1 Tax=Paenibacillus rigui TaxID=554312 RepID=A0A229UR70_9BACL|nr:DnaJ domain-containing protein [Paenibacillus rigui]OXM85389.1 molecular chaperone DnaJ [Paenibacillus rigui]
MSNYYEILGVERSAAPEEIKKAYKRLAKLHHPDVNAGSKQSELLFKQVSEAYQTLSDGSAREAYDARLNAKETKGDTAPRGSKGSQAGAGRSGKEQPHWDMKEMEQQFERFFGYHPKTGEADLKKKSGGNPLDTTVLFEKYFGMKKK